MGINRPLSGLQRFSQNCRGNAAGGQGGLLTLHRRFILCPVDGPIDKQPGSSERWKLVLTLGVTFLIAYYDRLNISLAMPLIAIENGWTDAETASNGALLMGLFYGGFGISNILLTPLGARFGPRASLITIVLLWSLFTALGAVASQVLTVFMASRVLLGLAEGIHPPMMNQLTHAWFALTERSRANSLWVSGLFLSVLTAPIVLVPIMERFGWRAGFYVLAVGGALVSLPLVLRFVYDRPGLHPRVPAGLAAELENRARTVTTDSHSTWHLLLERRFQILLLGGTLNNAVALGVASWLPTYLSTLRGVAYGDLSYLAAIPYGASLLGLALWATLGDRSNRRALVAAGGYFCAGILAAAALAAGSANVVWLTITLLSLAVFCFSAYTASEFAIVQRIVPQDRVASGVGLFNGLTTMIGGGLGPFLVGSIIDGGADPSDLATILGLCTLISLLLLAFSRHLRY